VHFSGPEANLGDAIARIDSEPKKADLKADSKPASKPAWQRALASARLPLYDVHWTPAVVVEARGGKRLRVGLADGRILPLTGDSNAIGRHIKQYDVVFVQVGAAKNARAELRVRPEVQGAALVLENKTGRVLAMTGGFSYPLSQLNRATQAQRQPGSAIKPLSYLAALENGLQPDTLIEDEPITFPPIKGRGEEWSPRNYEGGASGVVTLRDALANSRNLATVHLLQGGIEAKPEQSLERLCGLALEYKIYRDCAKYYPFVLGAQPVRPIDLAAFYAAIANEGARPNPHVVESIEQDGKTYGGEAPLPADVSASDRAAFYQLKTMLQGVLQHGTARALASLAPYVAGKTGTTEDQNDAWFVGFTNDVTIAVWVGYDNPGTERRTLGDGSTGAAVAAPIFQSIVEAAWSQGFAKSPLAPPSAEAAAELSCKSVDPDSGARRRHGSAECLRLDAKGKPIEARYRLVSHDSGASRRSAYDGGNRNWGSWGGNGYSSYGSSGYGGPNRSGGWFGWQPQRRGFWSW
jgi:membrane carboxypeptidase/penicillin-binding protein